MFRNDMSDRDELGDSQRSFSPSYPLMVFYFSIVQFDFCYEKLNDIAEAKCLYIKGSRYMSK